MATVHPTLIDDLCFLGVIDFKTQGTWPNRTGHYQLNLTNARRFGLTKSTAYRYLKHPPPYFSALVSKAARLQREADTLRAHALPTEWRDQGWWFCGDTLVLGTKYANSYQYTCSELVGLRWQDQLRGDEVLRLKAENERLKVQLKGTEPANDARFG